MALLGGLLAAGGVMAARPAPAPAAPAAAATAGAAAAEKKAYARYTPVTLAPAGDGFLLAGNAFSSPEESGCWVWRTDARGERLWEAQFPAREQDEIIDLMPTGDGGGLLLGTFFTHEPDVGYRAWLRPVAADGTLGARLVLPGFGRPGVLLPAEDGYWLVAATVERDKGNGLRDGDVRLLKVSTAGRLLWDRYFDRRANETVATGVRLANGREWALLVKKRVPGQAGDLWLFTVDASGQVTAEQTIPGGTVSAAPGRFLAATPDGLALVYSLAEPPRDDDELVVTTDPLSGAQVARFGGRLEKGPEGFLRGYPAVSTPALAALAGETLFLAGSDADGLRVEAFDAAWKSTWQSNMKSDTDGFLNFLVRDLHAAGGACYLLGNFSAPGSGNFNKSVFLLRVDVTGKAFDWLKAY
jgi:hypothetical protein